MLLLLCAAARAKVLYEINNQNIYVTNAELQRSYYAKVNDEEVLPLYYTGSYQVLNNGENETNIVYKFYTKHHLNIQDKVEIVTDSWLSFRYDKVKLLQIKQDNKNIFIETQDSSIPEDLKLRCRTNNFTELVYECCNHFYSKSGRLNEIQCTLQYDAANNAPNEEIEHCVLSGNPSIEYKLNHINTKQLVVNFLSELYDEEQYALKIIARVASFMTIATLFLGIMNRIAQREPDIKPMRMLVQLVWLYVVWTVAPDFSEKVFVICGFIFVFSIFVRHTAAKAEERGRRSSCRGRPAKSAADGPHGGG